MTLAIVGLLCYPWNPLVPSKPTSMSGSPSALPCWGGAAYLPCSSSHRQASKCLKWFMPRARDEDVCGTCQCQPQFESVWSAGPAPNLFGRRASQTGLVPLRAPSGGKEGSVVNGGKDRLVQFQTQHRSTRDTLITLHHPQHLPHPQPNPAVFSTASHSPDRTLHCTNGGIFISIFFLEIYEIYPSSLQWEWKFQWFLIAADAK